MILQDIFKLVDKLTPDERHQLRSYIDLHHKEKKHLTPEERIQQLEAASAAIREGLSETELNEMFEAMNQEYIED